MKGEYTFLVLLTSEFITEARKVGCCDDVDTTFVPQHKNMILHLSIGREPIL